MKILKYNKKSQQIQKILARSKNEIANVRSQTKSILENIRCNGDKAIREYILKYDNITDKNFSFRIKQSEINTALKRVPKKLYQAIKLRYENTLKLHSTQKLNSSLYIEEGIIAGELVVPLSSSGLYVPGGTASFPTVMQILATPAKVAGVPRIVACIPPKGATDSVLVAAHLSGVDEIYKIGGVAAIAALAYGTESINPVESIFGPGNVFVTAAKLEVYGNVLIDMPAGPSEAIIIADSSANPKWVAWDVLARAEHDIFAAGVVVTWSKNLAKEVIYHIGKLLKSIPRKNIAAKSLQLFSAVILVSDEKEAINFTNDYAPEHLEILTKNPFEVLTKIKNAGSIFLGYDTPVAVGDYLGISNHVLPSSGYAKMFSPISVRKFQKVIQFESISEEILKKYNKSIMIPLAKDEGFHAHMMSLTERVRKK